MATQRKRSLITYDDLVRTGPGTLAGRYMRRFWHPICLSSEIEVGRAKREQIMSEFVTLYRGKSGTLHAVADRCAHRGTQLSVGWVEDECIRCFYHGWKFDAAGQCVEQPAEKAGFAAKIKIRSYGVREYLGVVFLYLSEGEPPEFHRYPELEDDSVGGELVAAARAPVPCNFFQRVENAVDQVHVAFAHRDVFGLEGVPEVPEIWIEETEYGLRAHGKREGKQDRITHFHMPNINMVLVPPNKDEVGWAPNVVWRVPVDDTHHRSVNIRRVHRAPGAKPPARNYRRATTDRQIDVAVAILAGEMRLDELDPVADRNIIVAVQDNMAQLGQGPIAPRDDDHLGHSDVGVIAVRKLWRAELEALAENRPLRDWPRPPGGVVMTTGVDKELA